MSKEKAAVETAAECGGYDERKSLWLHVYQHHCCANLDIAQCAEKANAAVKAFDEAFPPKA